MIRRMQRQFVLLSVGSIALLLAVLLALLNLSHRRVVERSLYSTVRLIADQGGQLPADVAHGEDEALTAETPYQLRYFSVQLDAQGNPLRRDLTHIAAVASDQADRWAQQALGSRRSEAIVLRDRLFYAYHVRRGEQGALAVFLDCTREMRSIGGLGDRSITFGLFTLAGFATLIVLLSRRVVEPFIRSTQSQEQFITNAGHELKTPLAIIAADTEFLEMTLGESEWTESIRNQVQRMTTLVNRLIRLAKLAESREVELTELDLTGITRRAAESFRPLAQQQGKTLTLSIAEGVRAMATDEGYTELVSILVDNAVKYCDAQGEIRVTLSRRGRGRGCQLRVRNSYAAGAGLDMSRFFDRFYRQDQSHNSNLRGYGIGLSMAQGLAQEFHGKISALYRDRAITFVVTLP